MKPAIFLGIIAVFACSGHVNAGILTNFLDGPLGKAKTAVDSAIIDTIDKVQVAMDKAQKNVDSFVVNAQNWADETRAKIHHSLTGILDRIDKEIDNLKQMSEEQGIDLGHCEEIAHKVQRNIIELTDESTGCVTDRVHQVTKEMEPLKEKVSDMKNVLSEFLKSTAECVSDPSTSSVRNIACITDNNMKATFEIVKRAPALLFESARFTANAMLSPLPTGFCITKNYFSKSVDQSKSMLDTVKQCISTQLNKQKKNFEEKKKSHSKKKVEEDVSLKKTVVEDESLNEVKPTEASPKAA